jgi:hypothetical protein
MIIVVVVVCCEWVNCKLVVCCCCCFWLNRSRQYISSINIVNLLFLLSLATLL